jgi:formylglycine-generating enzyme required for sulfatase activity
MRAIISLWLIQRVFILGEGFDIYRMVAHIWGFGIIMDYGKKHAHKFINKLNEMEGGDSYRLPTEAEWEYAGRAETATLFSFGDDDNKLTVYAWFYSNSDSKTHRVGTKKPNPWGLHDMHGNVWEWVEDDWHRGYNGAPDDGRAWLDEPRGLRVGRGGGWDVDAYLCRSAVRGYFSPVPHLSFVGFRLARSVALGPKLSEGSE